MPPWQSRSIETVFEAQLAYVAHAPRGLGRLASGLRGMLAENAADAVAGADAVIVTHAHPTHRALAAATDKPVIDVARLWKSRSDQPANLCDIGW